MRQKLEEMKALSPWPMNPDISREVLSNWQALLEKGVVPQMQLAQQGSLTARSEHASTVTPALSRAFGASAERFSHEAGAMLDNTRVMVDGKTYTIRILLITAVILGIAILIFTDRYLVAMMVKPLERIRQQFQRIAQGDLSQPIEALGRNCVGRLVPLLRAMQDSLREAVSTIRAGSDNIWRGATEISTGNNDLFPNGRTGRCAGRDGRQHGTAYRNGENERRTRSSGESACGCRLANGRKRR